jgi:GTPase SAR1 family protein
MSRLAATRNVASLTEPTIADAREVVDLARKAASAYKRDDLARRAEQGRRRLEAPGVRVLVVGEFKQGKSSLVNALLGTRICPVDDDVATCVPTVLRYASEPRAVLHFADAAEREVAIADLVDHVSELGNVGNAEGIERAEVDVPSELLRRGLTIVDTPGVGGLGSKHGAMTMGVLPTADAVILVSDASQEYTAFELAFLRRARDLCPNLIAVVTKTDLHPEWRRIADLDAEHLRRHGFDAPMFPFSSSLRQLAIDTGDADADAESGYPALALHLLDEVVGRANTLAIRSAASDVLAIADQLGASFAAERAVLADPDAGASTMQRLEEAKAGSTRLMSQAARWQYTLSDGVADLNGDVEHDFRNRMRDLTRRAEEALDAADPIDIWDEFQVWLEQAMAHEVVENFGVLNRRTQELAARVADHFAEIESEVTVQLAIAAPIDLVDTTRTARADLAKAGLGAGVMTALRGSYGGALLFGMIARMIGIAALNPLVGVAGILMGRKAIKEERERALKQRRQESKLAVRKYIDDVSFSVGKEVRDAGRRTHRELRDLFAERAEALQRSTTAAAAAAERASQIGAGERAKRLTGVESELTRIGALRERALALAPDLRR